MRKTPHRLRQILACAVIGAGMLLGHAGEGHAQSTTLSQALYSKNGGGSSWWGNGGGSGGGFVTVNPDKGDLLVLGAGAVTLFNFKDDESTAGQFRFEYRPNESLWILRPFGGFEVSTEGSTYLYGGLLADVMLGKRVYVMPNAALGWYTQGGGRDLGYPLEFRSGLEVGWRFDGGWRAGVAMHHLSNANIADKNPGVEEVSLNVSMPLTSVLSLAH
ncbi:acyloxyacyl hydrolase [Pararhodospirillum oryzae]|uniref:Acyloxyacyl hydrolase n=1 Tax=Pararhodospirillum oryzae TaxID=478448 RepID=A0A512H996_9PROT|nr:acyloxyacyl hydrolase [Pararhodospirillum oryzae]GEO82021.1 hypothetical protein ROR02_21520 [Pararhodospirillum oryzae]